MRIESILNRLYRHKSFVYTGCSLEKIGGRDTLVFDIEPRKNGLVKCSICGQASPVYDTSNKVRLFDFVPLWNIPAYFRYRMRRVSCPVHGVRVERIPWAEGKSHLTKPYQLFLARWARKLSWKEVAESFGSTWDNVYRSVKAIVEYGMKRRSLDGITAIGVDEIQHGKGHQYLTLVYQINAGVRRLLFVGRDRKAKTLLRFFHDFGKERCARLKYVCSDMWKPYIKVISKKASQALHILDRFHIVQNLGKALNKIRAEEARRMKQEGFEEVLTHTKYCFLKKEENLTERQKMKLDEVLQYDLKSVRAYLLKESFQLFWEYKSSYWASWFLKKWCARAMRSRLEPIKNFVRMLRKHEPLIMNWFKAKKQYSNSIVEGMNRKINLVTRKSYGFRNLEVLKIALFHTMGQLPEPEFTHRFC
ncbi:MAG: ISL3 family transposase [Candidatus Euphemobacter frigidus]|nr:ISL3 family transposase [Candidatus Euphemobacter frigidus]